MEIHTDNGQREFVGRLDIGEDIESKNKEKEKDTQLINQIERESLADIEKS